MLYMLLACGDPEDVGSGRQFTGISDLLNAEHMVMFETMTHPSPERRCTAAGLLDMFYPAQRRAIG
jgi:hypothetical protein